MANTSTQLALTGDSVFNRFYNGYGGGKDYKPNFIIVNGQNYTGNAGNGKSNPLIKEITKSNDFLVDEMKASHVEMMSALNAIAELLKDASDKKEKNDKKEKKEKDKKEKNKQGKGTDPYSAFFGSGKKSSKETGSRVNALFKAKLEEFLPFLREGYFASLVPSELKKPFEFMKQLEAARNADAGRRYDADSGKWVDRNTAPTDKKEKKGMTKAITGLTSALLLKKKDDDGKKDGTLSTMLKMFLGGKILGSLMGAGKIFGMLALIGKVVLVGLTGLGIGIGAIAAGLVGFVFGDWLNKEFQISEKLAPFFDTIFKAGEDIYKYVSDFHSRLAGLLEWLDKDARKKAMKNDPSAYKAEDRQEMADADVEKEFAMWKANNWDVNKPEESAKKGAAYKAELKKRIEAEYGITATDKEYMKAAEQREKELGWYDRYISKPVGDAIGKVETFITGKGGDYQKIEEDIYKDLNGARIEREAFQKAVAANGGAVPYDMLPEELTKSQEAAEAMVKAADELAKKKSQLDLAEAQKAKNAQNQRALKEASVEEKITAAKSKEVQPIMLNNQPITNVTNNNGGGAVSGIMQTRNTEDSYTSNVRSNKSLVFAS